MFSLPLSDFQRLMARWAGYQPFHIVDAMEVREPVSVEQARRAAEDELNARGVAWPTLLPDNDRRVYYRDEPARIEVREYDAGADEPIPSVECVVGIELNDRLRLNSDPILRMWLLRGQRRSFVGMTFQHYTADGFAAGDLFRRILARIFHHPVGHDAFDDTRPLHPRAYTPYRKLSRFAHYVPDVNRELRQGCKSFTPCREQPHRTRLRPRIVELPADCLHSMMRLAKAHDATVNDILGTALAWSLGRAFPERYRKARRCVSISNMVDLRGGLGPEAALKWGAFLGFAIQHLPEPCPDDWREAIASVRTKSRLVKREKLYFASLGALWFIRRVWGVVPKRNRWTQSSKLMRSTAALSNSRLPPDWYADDWGGLLGDYRRFGPLGSLVPLIVVGTTKIDSFQLTMTGETGGCVAHRFDDIIRLLTECLSRC